MASGWRSKPSRSASRIEGAFSGAMIAGIEVGGRGRGRPSRAPPRTPRSQSPARAPRGLKIQPISGSSAMLGSHVALAVEEADMADQPAVRLRARPPTCRCRCSGQHAGRRSAAGASSPRGSSARRRGAARPPGRPWSRRKRRGRRCGNGAGQPLGLDAAPRAAGRAASVLECRSAARGQAAHAYFLPSVSPPKRLLKRATWPPVSSMLDLPPVHAGWTDRVDVEVQRVAFLAPGRAGLVLGAVGHLDRDQVIIGVGAGLHDDVPGKMAAGFRPACQSVARH